MKSLFFLHRRAIAIAMAFFALGTLYSFVNPLFEALDEVWHYPFVWHLARTGTLPVQDPANVQLWRQEGSQPPLYYALAALLTAPVPADDLPQLIYRNPHADLGVVTPDGNINMIVHTAREQLPWRGAALAAHLARIFSVSLSTGTVLTVYALGRTLWPQHVGLALLAMAFVAFNPMFLFVSASVNNDTLVTLLASLVMWQLVSLVISFSPPEENREQHHPPPPTAETVTIPSWRFGLLGLLIGLAALSKFSGLGLLGLSGLTLLWLGWRRRSWRIALTGNLIIVIITAAIAGWWYGRNLTLYGDWTGTQTMVEMMGPRSVSPTVGQLLAELPGMMRSFWGLFGGLSLAMPPALYWLLNGLLLVGFAGLPVALLTSRADPVSVRLQRVWPVLAGWLLLLLVGLVQWTLRTPATQGRLLFPGLAALAVLWAAGWTALLPRWLHPLPAALLLALAVWVPWGIIRPAYALPPPLTDLPASAQPLEIRFGNAVKLTGFELSGASASVRPGDQLGLRLYWRGLRPMETDYSVFIHLIDENGLIIAQRDLFHGRGLYPTSQWQPEQQFADTVILRLPRTTPAPATAHFGVGLYDNVTGARLPASSGGDTVTFGTVSIRPQPGSLPNPQDLQFEDNITLAGFAIDRQRVGQGETVNLTLYWESRSRPSANYKIFVHLVAEGDLRAAQHDSEPQGGATPTSTWRPGQTIDDTHPLLINDNAPPGAYHLKVGLYDGETGQRLRLLSDNGVSVQADSVVLGGVRIEP